jgi:hypothetical protein
MHHGTLGVAIVLVVMVQAAPSQGPPLFPLQLIPLQGQLPGGTFVSATRGLLVDVDADGDVDVVAGAWGQTGGFVVVPAFGGTFPTPGIAYPSAPYPADLVAVDVEADGDRDVIVLCHGNGPTTELWTYFNDGIGGFGAPPLVHVLTTSSSSLAVVRLDNDAIPDLRLRDGSSTWFLFGTGGGSYGTEVLFPMYGISGAAWMDDDADGDGDLHFVGNPAWFVDGVQPRTQWAVTGLISRRNRHRAG